MSGVTSVLECCKRVYIATRARAVIASKLCDYNRTFGMMCNVYEGFCEILEI